jgi:hypothetical protein
MTSLGFDQRGCIMHLCPVPAKHLFKQIITEAFLKRSSMLVRDLMKDNKIPTKGEETHGEEELASYISLTDYPLFNHFRFRCEIISGGYEF